MINVEIPSPVCVFTVSSAALGLDVKITRGRLAAVDFTVPGPNAQPSSKMIAGRLPHAIKNLPDRLAAYLNGEPVDFCDLPFELMDLDGATPFQKEVFGILATVPYGEVRSYGWLARACGKPRGAQAIGQALGRNPLPIILPCHRIIAASGHLGGFMRNTAQGEGVKTRLLSLEGHRWGVATQNRPALSTGRLWC